MSVLTIVDEKASVSSILRHEVVSNGIACLDAHGHMLTKEAL